MSDWDLSFMIQNSLRLIDRWMWQRPGMICDGPKVAEIDPTAAFMAFYVVVCCFDQ